MEAKNQCEGLNQRTHATGGSRQRGRRAKKNKTIPNKTGAEHEGYSATKHWAKAPTETPKTLKRRYGQKTSGAKAGKAPTILKSYLKQFVYERGFLRE